METLHDKDGERSALLKVHAHELDDAGMVESTQQLTLSLEPGQHVLPLLGRGIQVEDVMHFLAHTFQTSEFEFLDNSIRAVTYDLIQVFHPIQDVWGEGRGPGNCTIKRNGC